MRRVRVLALTAVLLGALLAPAATPALGANTTYVSVTGTTVSPTTPAPGDTVTVAATVRNLPSSSSSFDIQYARLLSKSGAVRGYASSLGSLAPGSDLRVPFTTSFSKPGTYHLTVEVRGTNDTDNQQTVTYPVVVTVRDDAPAVTVDGTNAVANADSPVPVTVANGLNEPIRNVRVSLSGDGVTVRQPRQVVASLASGASTTLGFDTTAAHPGTHAVTATVRYSTPDADRVTNYTVPVDFAALRDHVELSTKRTGDGSSLAVTVSNLGNAAIDDVSLTGRADGASVTGAAISGVPAGASKTAVVNTSGLDGEANVSLTATYDYGPDGRAGRATTTAVVAANPGRVTLTGLDVKRTNGKLHVSGSASNVGLRSVNSVVVRVLPSANVQPAYPGREYFVGTVPDSDFVSFDVYATASANATSVPLEVTYLADGVKKRSTVQVPLDASSAGSAGSTGSSGGNAGGGWVLPGVVGVVVVLVVAGLIYVGWRNYGGE